jgi:hypothetical protein
VPLRWAVDEFDTIKCGADIPKAMVGKRSSNERVVVIEARHSNLGLKDLGGRFPPSEKSASSLFRRIGGQLGGISRLQHDGSECS